MVRIVKSSFVKLHLCIKDCCNRKEQWKGARAANILTLYVNMVEITIKKLVFAWLMVHLYVMYCFDICISSVRKLTGFEIANRIWYEKIVPSNVVIVEVWTLHMDKLSFHYMLGPIVKIVWVYVLQVDCSLQFSLAELALKWNEAVV